MRKDISIKQGGVVLRNKSN